MNNDGNMNYKEHNKEVAEIWNSYNNGLPNRIPMILGLSSRYFMFNKDVNPETITYKDYTERPDIMFEMQVKFDHYKRMNIPADYEMGIPEKGWNINIDFQNYFEAAWLGCNIRYIDNNVPSTEPFLNDENKNMVFERGIPDPFEGIMGIGKKYYEYFNEKAKNFYYEGAGIDNIWPAFLCTDGPFTIACEIRGVTQFCIDLLEDPEYAHQLLNFITEATIKRLKAWRRYLGWPELEDGMYFADDSIALLSCDMYREFVLPQHKKLCSALSANKLTNAVHLCGDATRHFEIIKNELNVGCFDTGFPVDHYELVKKLGEDVRIQGGPTAELLRTGTKEHIQLEVKRILNAIKDHTKKFVLREANNVAPGTPISNIEAMYDACKKYGIYIDKF